ncbi:threonine aldolase family protein [Rhodopirellula sp. P2]|uniref:threonine aldolase family protein n=1 Tax=Rhodopirellula sp. P2 TaxID=2127060 RepID=UPI002368E7F0|nr:low specificity L-threonine aldolase [Rhodopirellula sp. P2]WDQ17540.1 low specificity L-threonine aldolase [Rhodopirellula sp. P2]
MFFASDNWAGAADPIAESLSRHAKGMSPAYGTSDLDRRLEQRFNELFETDLEVFFVGTGTAANSLALSAVNRPGGFVLCHRDAHLIEDECGAPEFFTSGARLAPVSGDHGKICPRALQKQLRRFDPNFVHHGQPMAVSVTQATEVGTVYNVDQLKEISGIVHEHKLPLHMDGARFANALVHLDLTPAEMTWKAGVDVLSFGGTKNGCWCAEAIIFFRPELAKQMPFIRKRAAQLFSKTRFIAAQFHAYLDDDLWLGLARHANAMAARLATGIEKSSHAELAWQNETNEVFVVIEKEHAERLQSAGARFYAWPTPNDSTTDPPEGHGMYRFVTSFCTDPAEIDQFLGLLG